MIACFLSNISAKYYKNPSMLSRVIAKNVGDVFFETQCRICFPKTIYSEAQWYLQMCSSIARNSN